MTTWSSSGPSTSSGPARPGEDVGVDAERLTGGRPGQHVEQHVELVPRLDDALHAHHRDVDLRQRGAHAAVALVLDEADRSGLGHREVATGDADVGIEERLPQPLARVSELGGDLRRDTAHTAVGSKQFGHVVPGLVDRRSDDVARRLPRQLDDELAQVGLDHLDARRLQRRVQVDLLAGHRLALGDQPRPALPGDIEDVRHGRGGVGGPEHACHRRPRRWSTNRSSTLGRSATMRLRISRAESRTASGSARSRIDIGRNIPSRSVALRSAPWRCSSPSAIVRPALEHRLTHGSSRTSARCLTVSPRPRRRAAAVEVHEARQVATHQGVATRRRRPRRASRRPWRSRPREASPRTCRRTRSSARKARPRRRASCRGSALMPSDRSMWHES